MLRAQLLALRALFTIVAITSGHVAYATKGEGRLPKSIAVAAITLQTLQQQYDGVVGVGSWEYEEDLATVAIDERIEAAFLFEIGRMDVAPSPLRGDRAKLRDAIYRNGFGPPALLFGKAYSGIEEALTMQTETPKADVLILVVQSQRATVEMRSRGNLLGSAAEGRAQMRLDVVLVDLKTKAIRKTLPLREPKSERYFADVQEMKRGGVPTIDVAGDLARTKVKDWTVSDRKWFFDYFSDAAVRSMVSATLQELFQSP